MSLGIAFKGAEGIVLAADSRVTLTAQAPGQPFLIPATFDNATKLLRVAGQSHVGAVTYGLGALGQQQPRTAHSFMPEFEAELNEHSKQGEKRLTTKAFAEKLSDFFGRQYKLSGMPDPAPPGHEMIFLVGGYDADEPYGHVFEMHIPTMPVPTEWHVEQFGIVWGGQAEFVQRLVTGYDPNLINIIKNELKIPEQQSQQLETVLKGALQAPIPFQFLPLQDCVDLAILLVRTTMGIQSFLVGVRGVGGAIDIATITRDGIREVQVKKITGEF